MRGEAITSFFTQVKCHCEGDLPPFFSREGSTDKVFREQDAFFGPEQSRLLVGFGIRRVRERTNPSALLAVGGRVSWLNSLEDLYTPTKR
jgi:hypothetical protein